MVAKPLCPLYKNIIKPLDRARYPELRYVLPLHILDINNCRFAPTKLYPLKVYPLLLPIFFPVVGNSRNRQKIYRTALYKEMFPISHHLHNV